MGNLVIHLGKLALHLGEYIEYLGGIHFRLGGVIKKGGNDDSIFSLGFLFHTRLLCHLGKMVPLCEQNEKMSIVLFWCCPYLAEPLVTSGMPVKKAQLLSKKLPIHPSYSRDVAQQSC
jgi:hypothetical protein